MWVFFVLGFFGGVVCLVLGSSKNHIYPERARICNHWEMSKKWCTSFEESCIKIILKIFFVGSRRWREQVVVSELWSQKIFALILLLGQKRKRSQRWEVTWPRSHISRTDVAFRMQEGSGSSVSMTFHMLYSLSIFIPLQVNIQPVR